MIDLIKLAKLVPRPPYIKGKSYLVNGIPINGIPKEADSRNYPNVIGTVAWEQFWNEELYYIKNGKQTGGLWVPGRYYYYMNYTVMNTVERGAIYPDNTDLHLELAYLIDYCKKNGCSLMIPKGRRRGISEASHPMVIDYGYRFSEEKWQGGVAAGHSKPIEDFITKWKFAETQLPPELFTGKLTKNNDEIIAGWTQKNDLNAWEDKGTFNTIYTRTMGNDPNMFKGLFLHDVVVEEVGEFEHFLEFFDATKDCLMSGQKQIGSMFVYGCVCAGTKVWDNYGNLINIEDLKHENGIVGFDIDKGETSKEFISYWQPPAEKMCYKITTNTGRTLECSEDHPIYIRDRYVKSKRNPDRSTSWKKTCSFAETKDLIIGDSLATIESVDIWSYKRMFEPRILGWCVGDGTYGGKQSTFGLQLISADQEVYDYVSSKYRTNINYSAPTKDGKTLRKFTISGIYLRDAFRDAGIAGQTKENKHLPKDLSSYCKKDVCEFIGGYFDADGCIYYNEKTREAFLKLTSAHFHLLDEVRFVLQKIGVRCNIMYEKPNFNNPKTTRGHYNLIIKDQKSILCFYDNISFFIKRKQSKLKKAVKSVRNNSYSRKSDVVKGLRFEIIKSVECIGMKPVYNLTAASTNTYVANGIVTHNTGGRLDKGSKGFKEAWVKDANRDFCKANNFLRFVADGRRFYYYGDASLEQQRLPAESELRKKYKDYQLKGVEDIDLAEKDILRRRKDYLDAGDVAGYNRFVQNNPINEKEIFRKTSVNNFDSQKLSGQIEYLQSLEHLPFVSYKGEYLIDKNTGMRKQPAELKWIPIKPNEDQSECVCILDEGHPLKSYSSRYCAGIDSYNIDQSKNSSSLGGMLVLDRETKTPVAYIRCRPKTKEQFYELCLKLAIYYKLNGMVLGDLGSDGIMGYFENAGYYNMLADRPKKFEALNSEQAHTKWMRLTTYSKPLMVGLMQFHINHHVDKIKFIPLLEEVGNYDEVAKESDNDLADAYGIALVQDVSCDVKPRDNEANEITDRFDLPTFVPDGMGGMKLQQYNPNSGNPNQDSEFFGLMFGMDK